MFKNIELSEINKAAVKNSMWVPVVTVAALLLIYFVSMVNYSTNNGGVVVYQILTVGLIMLVGTIVWGPALLICLLMETYLIRTKTTGKGILLLLAFEMLIPVLAFHLFLGEYDETLTPVSFFTAFIAQTVRWIYLKHKSRMYNFVMEPKTNYHGELTKATD